MKVDLLKDKIVKMFFLLFISAVGSTIIQTIYSSVDMICVGHYVGPNGAAAISCMNPIWSMMIAPGILVGVGGAVMMGNRRGAGNLQAGNEYFTVSTTASIIFSLIIFVALVFFPEPLLRFFGADGEVLELSLIYMRCIAICCPTFTVCATLATFMRNEGETVVPAVATVMGGVVNIALDVFLVFDFGMGLGILGAGLATSIGQLVAFSVILGYFFTSKCTIKFTKTARVPRKLLQVFTLGVSAFILELSFGVSVTVFNKIIIANMTYDHLAVYGTASSVLGMMYGLLMGIGTALQPIVAANHGAEKHSRVRSTLKISVITAVCMGVLFFAVVQIFPSTILNLYMSTNEVILEIGPSILTTYCLALPISGITMVIGYYLQSLLKRWMSLTVSLLRGLLLPVAFAFALPYVGGINAIWFSIPAAELVTFAVALIFLLVYSREREPDGDNAEPTEQTVESASTQTAQG